MRCEREIREVEQSFRALYGMLPDGDLYKQLSLIERVLEWVLGE